MLPRIFGALFRHLDASRLERARANQGPLDSTPSRSWSRRSLSAAALAAPLFLVSQALTSCGDDSGGGGCEAGQINPCTCVGGDMGEQVCNAEGTGFGACDCDGTGGGNGGSSGAAGSAGDSSMAGSAGMSMDPPLDIGFIGAPCQTDADCTDQVPGFTCIEPNADGEFGTGGPEGGYCTLPCEGNADCANVDGASACAQPDDNAPGFCIALCQPGLGDGLLKCGNGDRAQACYPNDATASIGACFPACTSDEGCGNGRVCDLGGLNLCVETQSPGGGIGAACTEATEMADCASGICLEFPGAPGEGFCSAFCTTFSSAGCGYPPGATGPRDNFCLQPVLASGGPGDIGFCYELCDADGDCLQDDWSCDFFESAELQAALGRQGQCVPSSVDGDEVGDAGPG